MRAFALMEMFFKVRLKDGKSIALIIEYAETIVPMAGAAQYNPEDRGIQVFLQKWATDSLFIQNDMTIVLLTESINNINSQYVRNPNNFEALIPYPDEGSRLNYIKHFLTLNPEGGAFLDMPVEVLAKNTAGLD